MIGKGIYESFIYTEICHKKTDKFQNNFVTLHVYKCRPYKLISTNIGNFLFIWLCTADMSSFLLSPLLTSPFTSTTVKLKKIRINMPPTGAGLYKGSIYINYIYSYYKEQLTIQLPICIVHMKELQTNHYRKVTWSWHHRLAWWPHKLRDKLHVK